MSTAEHVASLRLFWHIGRDHLAETTLSFKPVLCMLHLCSPARPPEAKTRRPRAGAAGSIGSGECGLDLRGRGLGLGLGLGLRLGLGLGLGLGLELGFILRARGRGRRVE